MVKRVILFLVIICSLAWIGFYALEILDEENNYKAEELFGFEDGAILIVSRPNETNVSLIKGFESIPSLDMINGLNDSLIKTAYFSQNRDHFLLVANQIWTQELIQKVLTTNSVQWLKKEQFKVGDYTGRFHKKHVYLSRGEITVSDEKHAFTIDKKASATKIKFAGQNEIASYTDIYFKTGGLINYITKNANIEGGNQVSDEDLFSGVISRNISSYHFYERDYFAFKDSVFRASPMFAWLQFGFVEVEHNGSKAIIADYIQGQDPVLVLNELNESYDTTWFTNQLTSTFPKNGMKYKVEFLEDFVVISADAALCKKLISDYKLGNTIALNEQARARYFGNLPKNVSERIVSKEESLSRSAYHGKILESINLEGRSIVDQVEKTTISISAGGDIKDFYSFQGDGNIVVLTENGQLKRFVNEKEEWSKSIEGEPLGKIQIIDLHANGEKHILLNTSEKIYLFNLNGESSTGFPVSSDEELINEVKFYRWKGKSYFLIGYGNSKMLHLDAKGRELNILKIAIAPDRMINVWASQNRLFAGLSNGSEFEMYDMDKRRSHRTFALPSNAIPFKVPNELLHYGTDQSNLYKCDQKGALFKLGDFSNAKVRLIEETSPQMLIVQSGNELHLLNMEGIPFGEIRLPFNEIDDIFVENNEMGKTIVGVIDGLENNVYLYGTDGNLLKKKNLEGQNKLMIHSSTQGYRITTIVDQFVVQYFEN